MKTIEKISDKFIYFSILIMPIINIITSIMTYNNITISLGMIINSVILLISYILFFAKKNISPWSKGLLISFTFFLILTVLNNFNLIYPKFEMDYIKVLIKYSYLIVLIFFFKYYFKEKKYNIEILKTPIKIILISLLLSVITNTAMPSYSLLNKIGITGWFYSANELGSLLVLLFPISIYIFFHSDNSKRYEYLYVIIHAFSLILLGTKVGLLGCISVLIAYILYRIIFIKKFRFKNGLILILLMAISIGICWNFLPTVKNMEEKYTDLVNDKNNANIKEPTTVPNLPNQKQDILNEMIYSGRQEFLNEIKNSRNTSTEKTSKKIYNNLLGKPYYKDNTLQLIERDFHDIYYIFGLTGLLFLFATILLLNIKDIKKIILKIFDLRIYMILLSIILALGVSYISGHTLLSPMVSFYLAILLSLLSMFEDKSTKKQILINSVHLDFGGIEKTLLNLLNKINYNKYEVHLFLQLNSGNLKNELNENVVIKVPYSKILGKIINNHHIICKMIKHLLYNKYTAFIYTENRKYDVAIDYAGYYDFITSYAINANANKKLIWVHASPNSIIDIKDRKKYRYFDKIVLVSNDAKKEMEKMFPEYKEKYNVMWNIISMNKTTKEKIKWKNGCLKLLAVGRLCDQKRFDRLIDALKLLKEDKVKFELKILGDGPLLNELKKQAEKSGLSNNIMFCGNKSNVSDYMESADLYLMTSDYEGLPTVLLEALSCNLPYIAMDVCGVHEISKNIAPKNSFIMTKIDIQEFKNAIKSFNLKNTFNFDLEKYNQNNLHTFENLIEK